MKYIPLTQGQYAMVDDEDEEWLSQWKWYVLPLSHYSGENKFMATMSHKKEDGRRKTLYMHRVIMEINNTKVQVDHIDGDPLNNQRHNLRLCVNRQNMYNQGRRRNNRSGYKGVSWNKQMKKFEVRIMVNDRKLNLGLYNDAIEAALAYDTAARKYHGEYANTNFSLQEEV